MLLNLITKFYTNVHMLLKNIYSYVFEINRNKIKWYILKDKEWKLYILQDNVTQAYNQYISTGKRRHTFGENVYIFDNDLFMWKIWVINNRMKSCYKLKYIKY